MDLLKYHDDLGPEKVLYLYDPATKLKAVLVIDNTAIGPSIGGIRMAVDVTDQEAFRLARAMTFKNAAAGLPHGGGKAVIQADAKALSVGDKEVLIRSFARAIRNTVDYIPGPDMGTNEVAMAWIKDEIGRAVGLPNSVGGIPLDEIGATGIGIACAAEVASNAYGIPLSKASVVIQGFGAVGKHAALKLADLGAKIIAVADSKGSIINYDGLDIAGLIALKQEGRSVDQFAHGTPGASQDVIGIKCDIWIPAARPDVIHKGNVELLDAKIILQGANIPITSEAETILHHRGIYDIPDFICNAGGVICAAVEYQGLTEEIAVQSIREKISKNTKSIIEISNDQNCSLRDAALLYAKAIVQEAMSFRK